jgi:hypothetical protein
VWGWTVRKPSDQRRTLYPNPNPPPPSTTLEMQSDNRSGLRPIVWLITMLKNQSINQVSRPAKGVHLYVVLATNLSCSDQERAKRLPHDLAGADSRQLQQNKNSLERPARSSSSAPPSSRRPADKPTRDLRRRFHHLQSTGSPTSRPFTKPLVDPSRGGSAGLVTQRP